MLTILVLVGIVVCWNGLQSSYGQPPGRGWKIVRFGPKCYLGSPDKDTPITVKAMFEYKGPSPGELLIEVLYVSNIETVKKPKFDLTQAVATTCGPRATICTVNWDGEPLKVEVDKRGRYIITKDGIIGPRVRGNIKITIWIYTKDARGERLTDEKKFTIKPCPPGARP